MLNTSFSPWPSYTNEEAEAVSAVLLSNKVNYWTGSECRQFEDEFAKWTNSKYAIALSNGTVALDLALIALGIGNGDEVVVTSRTFLASVSSIVNSGAIPIFADVDSSSQNITAESIEEVLSPRTKAILCVHLAGWPCDMDSIMNLADKRSLYVIEDCAQAHGAKYKGKSVGSIGHIGAWSFCQDKIMTTGGEGGMVTTNTHSLWNKMWSYKDHGKSWDAVYNRQHPPGFRWLHESFGTNWRMTEVQAVIGRIQLRMMNDWTLKRQLNAEAINNTCEKFDCLRVAKPGKGIHHACYKHYVFVKPEKLKDDWSRDRIIDEIIKKGIPCFQGSCSEVYLEKAFDNTNFRPSKPLPVAKELGETSLMFLVHPTLTADEIKKTCNVIRDVVSQASNM
ncbi:DegT/DnrJ/EryC1/StrS aminotransferase family protein [Zooshikella marina]|uniref:DegT/DnrJ/EryC1/StrS family aminotransferase n=1 Tax=Zooshikella ganghwensis TaxID=202772 RepID=UPI001BB0C4EA|nr:DegT/DnrJ/EryC1/StrS aminotransferase family protein [Zooshikella ganghwensis]MBU2704603.1 DegT/DnrJ/EryC1/StrS aminotransferase family protein [Zooshikella ganghwensis]